MPVAEIAVNLAFVAVTTRVLFALAFDRLLPVSVAKVNERNHAPVVAIGIVHRHRDRLLHPHDVRQPDQHRRAGEPVLRADPAGRRCRRDVPGQPPLRSPVETGATDLPRWLGVPRSRWAGGLTTVLALFTIVEVLVHSSVYGKFSAESITTLVVVLGAGPVIYLIASSLRRRRNQIDIGMSMRELPPE